MAKQVETTYGDALLELALEEGSLDMLYEEAQALVTVLQVKRVKNIVVASVTSAVSLTGAQKASIEKRLLETTDFTSMEVTYTVDASIIGGLVIRIDDRVVDSSIKTKIETMSKALAQS